MRLYSDACMNAMKEELKRAWKYFVGSSVFIYGVNLDAFQPFGLHQKDFGGWKLMF